MLILVRHGQASANAAGLLLGRTDVELTQLGIEEISRWRARLGAPTALITSPLRRARDSAALLELGLEARIDERWIEVDYGEHEGKPLSDVPADIWKQWRHDLEYRPAGGESLAEVGRRVRLALGELFDNSDSPARAGDVVVVSHVSPIKAAVAWALGGDDQLAWRLHLGTASVTRIAMGAVGPVLESFNERL